MDDKSPDDQLKELPDWWETAVRLRAEEAEQRFQQGEPLSQTDIVATALLYPDVYEIVVRRK